MKAWLAKDTATYQGLLTETLRKEVRLEKHPLSINPSLARVKDLALYKFRGKVYTQFDIQDQNSGRVYPLDAWLVVEKNSGKWQIANILRHFDPDAGP